MILSDREIKAALARGAFHIAPELRTDLLTSTALDLTLDGQLNRWEIRDIGDGIAFDPAGPHYDYDELVKRYSRPIAIPPEGLVVAPKDFHLGWTIERIKLPYPSRIAARVEGKSGLARLGLGVHVTAPTIHAGFGAKEKDPTYPGSPIQLVIWNFATVPIRLRKGMLICQLIFEIVDGTPEKGYVGRHSIQGPQLPA